MQIVILAGGLGTRMRPATDQIPKALLPVAGEPFAHHQLRLLATQGVERVIYCIAYRGDAIRRSIGSGDHFGVRVTYVDEGRNRRGTAGALRLALDHDALDRRFAVLYGDSYLPIDLAPVWELADSTSAPAVMTVLRNRGRWDTSNAAIEHGLVIEYGKGRPNRAREWIDYGLTVLDRRIIERDVQRDAKADLSDVYARLAAQRELAAFEVQERFYEIGSPQGLAALEARVTRATS